MVLMHAAILPAPKGMVRDHINGNGLDNRRVNLRIVTPLRNSWNQKTFANNRLGVAGVRKRNNRFQARITLLGKQEFIGSFDTLESAKEARRQREIEVRGEYART